MTKDGVVEEERSNQPCPTCQQPTVWVRTVIMEDELPIEVTTQENRDGTHHVCQRGTK